MLVGQLRWRFYIRLGHMRGGTEDHEVLEQRRTGSRRQILFGSGERRLGDYRLEVGRRVPEWVGRCTRRQSGGLGDPRNVDDKRGISRREGGEDLPDRGRKEG